MNEILVKALGLRVSLLLLMACVSNTKDSTEVDTTTGDTDTSGVTDTSGGTDTSDTTGPTDSTDTTVPTDSTTDTTDDTGTTWPGNSWTAIAASFYGICGLSSTQRIDCWGSDTTHLNYTPSGSFSEVGGGCALTTAGEVECWGDHIGDAEVPSGPFHALNVGDTYACALDAGNAIACWGTIDFVEPPAGEFVQVALGGERNCALAADGTIVCWGSKQAAVDVAPTDDGYVQVSCGEKSCCALKDDGTVTCWSEYGKAGPRFEEPVYQVAVGGTVESAYGGEYWYPRTVAIGSDRTRLLYWSESESSEDATVFSAPDGEEWVQVTAMGSVTCALTNAGSTPDELCYGDTPEAP